MGTRLFIGNLSYNVTEQELREAFGGEGIELRSVRVALDRETGRPRGFAFVETMTDDGAKASIEKLSGRVLQGRVDHRRGGAGQAGRAPAGRRLRWRRLAPEASAGHALRAAPADPADRVDLPVDPEVRADRWAGRPAATGRIRSAAHRARGGPPRDFGPPRGPGGIRHAGGPAAPMRRRGASAPRRSVRRAPSRKSRSGATGAGTATPTTIRTGGRGRRGGGFRPMRMEGDGESGADSGGRRRSLDSAPGGEHARPARAPGEPGGRRPGGPRGGLEDPSRPRRDDRVAARDRRLVVVGAAARLPVVRRHADRVPALRPRPDHRDRGHGAPGSAACASRSGWKISSRPSLQLWGAISWSLATHAPTPVLPPRPPRSVDPTKPSAGYRPLSALRGEIDQISLASVLTVLEMERKTGLLLVERSPRGRPAAPPQGADRPGRDRGAAARRGGRRLRGARLGGRGVRLPRRRRRWRRRHPDLDDLPAHRGRAPARRGAPPTGEADERRAAGTEHGSCDA